MTNLTDKEHTKKKRRGRVTLNEIKDTKKNTKETEDGTGGIKGKLDTEPKTNKE